MSLRILYVVPYVPGPIRVRPHNLIRHLAKRGHRVAVLTLFTDEAEREEAGQLSEYCEAVLAFPQPRARSAMNCLQAIPTKLPLQAVYSWNPHLMRELAGMATARNGQEPYDLVQVEHLRGGPYVERLIPLLRRHRVPVVWDSVDCISLLFRQAARQNSSTRVRLAARLELRRTEEYERRLLSVAEHILISSEGDRQALLSLAPDRPLQSNVHVLPNGVDLGVYQPANHQVDGNATLVMSGKMSYHANVAMALHFADNVLPRIWNQRPEVELWIVGKKPPRKVKALSNDPRIHVTGTVLDIRPYIERAGIAVVPLTYGVGIQNKVLEAMAMGKPIVATPRAVGAMDIEPGRELIVAGSDADFAEAVVRLLDDGGARRVLAQSARRFVEKNHSWGSIAHQLEEIYRGILAR